jgi:hypothetical protein
MYVVPMAQPVQQQASRDCCCASEEDGSWECGEICGEARLLGVEVGGAVVGYCWKNNNLFYKDVYPFAFVVYDQGRLITFMTAGILRNEARAGRLDKYAHVILDEAHVFDENMAILLASYIQHQAAVKNVYSFRVTVMSATISDEFARTLPSEIPHRGGRRRRLAPGGSRDDSSPPREDVSIWTGGYS